MTESMLGPGLRAGTAVKQSARTHNAMNLHVCDASRCPDGWFPDITGTDYVPERLVSFNRRRSAPDGATVHFFIDDYRFEAMWRNPERYMASLARFRAVLSPDFSAYTDMPRPVQLYNEYRRRVLHAAMERVGIEVIPTVTWSTPDMDGVFFSGMPKGGTVAVSTVGCARRPESREGFSRGMSAMLQAVKPRTVLVYGDADIYDFSDANAVFFKPDTNGAKHGR